MPSPLDVFFLAISSILFVMYVVFLISLIAYHSNAPLRSGFFKLTFMLGLFDVLQMTHMYIFLRFPSFGWMTDDFYLKLPPGVAHYASCTMWALAFNQHVTVLFIALNRFSAVVFPYGHKRFWRRSRTRVITIMIALSGPVYVAPKVFLSNEQYTIISSKRRTATIVWDDQDLLQKYKNVGFCTLIIASSICFLCYCSIIYVTLRRHMISTRRKTANSSRRRSSTPGLSRVPGISGVPRNSGVPGLHAVPDNFPRRKSGCSTVTGVPCHTVKNGHSDLFAFSLTRISIKSQNRSIVSLMQKRELRLATCGFIIFFSMFVYTIGVANMGVSESPGKQQDHRNIWMAASDIFSGINPILLIIVSKSLRNRFLAVLCCSCKERHYSPSQSM